MALSLIPEEPSAEEIQVVTEKTSVIVLDIKDDIVSYKHTSTDGEFKIEKSSYWYVKDNKNVEVSQNMIYKMLGIVSKLSTKTLVEENSTDISRYGLDKPTDIIEIFDVNNDKYLIKIGSKTSTESGYYANINNDSKIFILSEEDYKIICGGLNSLRDKNVISYEGDIVSVAIKNPSSNMSFAYKESENVNSGNFSDWEMISPYKKDVNQYIFENNVLNALVFAIDDFVDDNPTDYDFYGLSKPLYSVKVTTTQKQYTLYFGKKTEDNMVFFKTDSTPNVYCVNKDLVKFIEYTPVYLLESLVFSRNISAVKTITFRYDNTYVIKISEGTYLVNGKKADEKLVREVFRSFISPVIQGEVKKGKTGNEICSFTFDYNTGTPPETVVFYEYDKMYAAVSINGTTDFYVKRSYVDDMINSAKKLSE